MAKYIYKGILRNNPAKSQVRPSNNKINSHSRKIAVRVCLLRNGDIFFEGVCVTVSSSYYKSFDILLEAFTEVLRPHTLLGSAITHLFRIDGSPITSINSIQFGDIIVCCCQYEPFIRVSYKVNKFHLNLLDLILRKRNNMKYFTDKPPRDLPTSIGLLFKVSEPILRTKHITLFTGHGRLKTDTNYLIKMVEKKYLEEVNNKSYQEIQIIRQLQNHKNIVELISTVEELNNAYIIQQRMDCSLYKLMLEHGPFSETATRQILRDVISGIKHIHCKKIIHRNIKPENMLVELGSVGNGNSPEISVVKISDFGLATFYNGKKMYQCCGTAHYMAPEMIRQSGYDFGVDMWSLGITLVFILSNRYPYGHKANNSVGIFQSILHSRYHIPKAIESKLNTELKELLDTLLKKKSIHRITAKDVKNHPFLHNG